MSQTDDLETCRAANEAALEKGLSFCETPEARVQTLARLVGYESDDIDPAEILSLDPEDTDAETRKRVLARTEEIIADGEDQPLDAISQAWSDVSVEQGPDHDEETDTEEEAETEADAEEEAGAAEAVEEAEEDPDEIAEELAEEAGED